MQPASIGLLKGAVVGIGLGLMGFAIAAQPAMALGGEPHPRGYGTQPCPTLAYDLAVSQTAYDPWEFQARMNLIGCTQDGHGAWVADPHENVCGSTAQHLARRHARNGLSDAELAQIARDVSQRFSHNGTEDHCTLEEDWSWSFR